MTASVHVASEERHALPPECPFPPAPWHLIGDMWSSLAHVDIPPELPPGCRALLPRSLVAIVLIRYRGGVLNYDELAYVSPVHVAGRSASFVHRIWVDSHASLWGGRKLWSVPKELAHFEWSSDSVSVESSRGLIAEFGLRRGRFSSPQSAVTLPLLSLDAAGERVFCNGRITARFAWTRLSVKRSSRDFPCRSGLPSWLGVGAQSFDMVVG